mmetsp:Transcript_30702/g.117470  ORF Transcript_30702/g.117470 Transcript_30702/m.117470 type:complete len:217 (-) Transcript_30702:414-1064(-)
MIVGSKPAKSPLTPSLRPITMSACRTPLYLCASSNASNRVLTTVNGSRIIEEIERADAPARRVEEFESVPSLDFKSVVRLLSVTKYNPTPIIFLMIVGIPPRQSPRAPSCLATATMVFHIPLLGGSISRLSIPTVRLNAVLICMRVFTTSRGCKRSVVIHPEVAPAKKFDADLGLPATISSHLPIPHFIAHHPSTKNNKNQIHPNLNTPQKTQNSR